jgi:hypothetical protein
MQALKMKVQIHDNQIAASLPISMPDGEAEIIVLYEAQTSSASEINGKQDLFKLFSEIDQSTHTRMSKAEVDAHLETERASWN